MSLRALHLYILSLLEALHRLRHDFARELVVLISSLVLFATFLYVFNDFLNVQIATLSTAMRDRFAEAAAVVVLAVAAGTAGRILRHERFAQASVRRMALSLGETAGTVAAYVILWQATVILIVHGLGWVLVRRYLVLLAGGPALAAEAAMLAVSATVFAWPAGKAAAEAASVAEAAGLGQPVPRINALMIWRLRQMRRGRLTRLCAALAAAFLLLVVLAGWRAAPPFVPVLAGLTAGYLAAAALCFQMGEDVPYAWAERGLGVTHDEFVAAYQRLGLIVGGAAGSLAAVLWLAATLAGAGSMSYELVLNTALKLFAVTAVPGVVAPLLLLQIDPRRPGINLVLTLIVALFVGTAVFAHWLGLLLLPILRYYALRTQAGRFYRA